jgi:hypothetical protein
VGLGVLDLSGNVRTCVQLVEIWQMVQSRGLPLSQGSSRVVHRFLRRTAGERRVLPAFWRLGSDEIRLVSSSGGAFRLNVVVCSEDG